MMHTRKRLRRKTSQHSFESRGQDERSKRLHGEQAEDSLSQVAGGGRWTIAANLMSGEELAKVKVAPMASVEQLKYAIVQASGLERRVLQLAFNTKMLDAVMSLEESGLHDCANISAFLRDISLALCTSSGMSGVVQITNVSTGQTQQTWRCKHDINTITVSNEDYIFVASSLILVTACNKSTGKSSLILECGFDVMSCALSPASNLIASGDNDGVLSLWPIGACELPVKDTFREHPSKSWQAAPNQVIDVKFSPIGAVLASRSVNEEGLILWNAATGRRKRTLRGGRRGSKDLSDIDVLTFSPDGGSIAMVISDVSVPDDPDDDLMAMWVELWHVDGRKPYKVFKHGDPFPIISACVEPALAFSPNGMLLAVSDTHGQVVHVWNVQQGNLVQTLNAGAQARKQASPEAWFCSFSPDNSLLVTGIQRTVHMWCTRTWRKLPCFNHADKIPKGKVSALQFMPMF